MRLFDWLDHFTVPTLLAVNAAAYWPETWQQASAVLAGYVTWTFAEYFIHRTVLHRWMRKEHWEHHLHPQSYDAAVPQWMIHALLLGVYLSSLGLLGWTFGSDYFVGMLTGYMTYIYAHNAIHWNVVDRESAWPFGAMVRRHDLHHDRGMEVNFNVLNPLGDIVFGTFRRVGR